MAPKFMATFLMLTLALFAFVPTKAATSTTCPDLNVCASMAAGSLNIAFGSQSSSQCCSKLNGLSDSDAVTCICNTIKTLASTTISPVLGGTSLLGGVIAHVPVVGGVAGPVVGGLLGAVGGLVGNIPVVGGLLPPVIGIIGGGSASGSASTTNLTQQFSAITNGCGLTTPTTFTCA